MYTVFRAPTTRVKGSMGGGGCDSGIVCSLNEDSCRSLDYLDCWTSDSIRAVLVLTFLFILLLGYARSWLQWIGSLVAGCRIFSGGMWHLLVVALELLFVACGIWFKQGVLASALPGKSLSWRSWARRKRVESLHLLGHWLIGRKGFVCWFVLS